MERVQTQFLICRKSGCSFDSVGLIFAHVVRFWDFGPALAPYWAHVKPSWAILGSVSAFVLDLGISVSLNFRPCKAFAKNTINAKPKNTIFGLRC